MPETLTINGIRILRISTEGDRLLTRQNALHRLTGEVGSGLAKQAVQDAEHAVGHAIAALYRAANALHVKES